MQRIFLWVLCCTLGSATLAADIPKTLFIQFMKTNAPEILCSNTALLSCLELPQTQCLDALVQPNIDCAASLSVTFPDQFAESDENTRHYGSLYSQCLLTGWKTTDPMMATPIETCFGL